MRLSRSFVFHFVFCQPKLSINVFHGWGLEFSGFGEQGPDPIHTLSSNFLLAPLLTIAVKVETLRYKLPSFQETKNVFAAVLGYDPQCKGLGITP